MKVSASVAFAALYIVPLVPAFLKAYPQVELDLSLTDSVIDLIDERADIAVRTGPMPDSSLKARKLIDSCWVVVASPEYLARHGRPETPADLINHNCMLFNLRRNFGEWPFVAAGGSGTYNLPVRGNFLTNNGLTIRRACLQGVGICRIAAFDVERELASGALVQILQEYTPDIPQVVHAVYAGHDHLAARIRAFIDFMAANIGKDLSV